MLRILTTAMLLIGLVACGGGESPPPSVQRCSIELNGDSIISSNHVISFAEYLQFLRPNYDITDNSVGGFTLRNLVEGYIKNGTAIRPFSELPRRSDIVLVELGGNDAHQGVDDIKFQQLFTSIIDTILMEDRIPVVTGIIPLVFAPEYPISQLFSPAVIEQIESFDQFIHDFALNNNVYDVNWRTTVSYSGPIDTVDGVHLTRQASERFARRTAEVLDAACATAALRLRP